MEKVRLEGITKVFRDGRREVVAVDNLSLTIEEGEFLTLLGPSGCGKTTTLRMIGGFEVPTRGKIYISGEDVTDLPPNKRSTAMVFQSYALFPHMTVFDNIAYGLRIRKLPKEEIERRVKRVLEMVNLLGFEKRYPGKLSGGQQQRVALARALVVEPEVLLLDEPLSNLDAKLREQMRMELKRIQKETGITFVYVTHDQAEAMVMSDRVVVMKDGRAVQVDTPEMIYRFPANTFVAKFIGTANLFEVEVLEFKSEEAKVRTPWGGVIGVQVREGDVFEPGERVSLVVRPEGIKFTGDGAVKGKVVERIYMGSREIVMVEVNGMKVNVEVQNPLSTYIPEVGEETRMDFSKESMALVRD